MRFLLPAVLLLSIPASAEVSNSICRATGSEICSKTFYGSGVCSGLDKLPILQEPWETRPIRVTGVAITVDITGRPRWHERLRGAKVKSFAFAGNSASPDVMAVMSGTGSTQVHFPGGRYFTFPGKTGKDDPHVDLHVQCLPIGARFESMLTIFYEVDH